MTSTIRTAEFRSADSSGYWSRLNRRYREPSCVGATGGLPVRVLRADGTELIWRHRQQAQAAKQAAGLTGKDLVAVEYPEDRLLRRHLTLPDMTAQDVAQAAALDASSAAPFPAEDLVWGHACTVAPDGRLELDVVMASRKHIQAYLESLGTPRPASHQPEVWAWSDSGAPVVIQGFGEARRYRQLTQRRWAGWALLASACVLAAAIAVTPTAQLRLDAIEAVHSYDALHQRTAPWSPNEQLC